MTTLRRSTALVATLALAMGVSACGDDDAKTDPARLEGTWILTEFADDGSVDPLLEAEITLEDGRLTGSGGVNRLTGSYEAKDDGTITFSDVASTKMAGEEAAMTQEARLLESLEAAERFEVDTDDESAELELSTQADVTLLEFVAAP